MPLYLFLPFDNKGKVYTWSIVILDKPNVYTNMVVTKRRRICVGFSVTIDLCGMKRRKDWEFIPGLFCLHITLLPFSSTIFTMHRVSNITTKDSKKYTATNFLSCGNFFNIS